MAREPTRPAKSVIDGDGIWIGRGALVLIWDTDERGAPTGTPLTAGLVDMDATDAQGRPVRVVPPEELG